LRRCPRPAQAWASPLVAASQARVSLLVVAAGILSLHHLLLFCLGLLCLGLCSGGFFSHTNELDAGSALSGYLPPHGSSPASPSCSSMCHSKNTLAGAVTGINNKQSINPTAHEDMNANPQQDGFLPSPAQQAPLSCLNPV